MPSALATRGQVHDEASETVAEAAANPERLIGPNAITQLDAVLREHLGPAEARAIFRSAALEHHQLTPPEGMVDETDVARLHRMVRDQRPRDEASELLREAGDRTGRYILAHRIPGLIVWALPRLPRSWAAALLGTAIEKHAWTFAGSGQFSLKRVKGPGLLLRARIENNPFMTGTENEHALCIWHAAVFQRLFRTLVDPACTVVETQCCAQGATACEFDIRCRSSEQA